MRVVSTLFAAVALAVPSAASRAFVHPAAMTQAAFQSAGPPAASPSLATLDVYLVDVEGGQATLVVTPSRQSMLIDAGWPGLEGRDASRIEAAMKQAGITSLDYLVVTHYHTDHVGGVPAIAARVPVGTFVDHGPTFESATDKGYLEYLATRARGRHLQVKPGDRIPLAGVDVTVVAAAGDSIRAPLAGAGGANPLCAAHQAQADDASENARSVGVVIAYGAFRMVDLGDLTWNKEHALACPVNLLGGVDAYLTTHHGHPLSGPPALVHALAPRVALMNNGAKKGGAAEAWRIVKSSPSLIDFWQLHTSISAGPEFNTGADLIANPDESTAHGLKLSARADGSFTVTNSRNSVTKTYPVRSAAR